MPKYSELLSDEAIINLIDSKCKNVLLLGCGGCMNESLAFKYSLPIISYENGGDITCPAIEYECKRLAEFLNDKGFLVSIFILVPNKTTRCMRNMDKEIFILPDNIKPDIVLVISCQDGFWRCSREIIKDVPLLRISKWVGSLFYLYFDDGKYRKIEDGNISFFDNQNLNYQ